MEVVRLGQGVDATGRLAPEAIERTRLVLAEYAAQAAELGATAVRMVATSATRDAENRTDFEHMVNATLGQLPDVVTGREEAELSFLGATASLAAAARGGDPPRPPFLVVDIGGGGGGGGGGVALPGAPPPPPPRGRGGAPRRGRRSWSSTSAAGRPSSCSATPRVCGRPGRSTSAACG